MAVQQNSQQYAKSLFNQNKTFLTDPILTGPTPDSINVVWYLEGSPTQHTGNHYVLIDIPGAHSPKRFEATLTQMSQMFEDKQSQLPPHITLDKPANQAVMERPISRVSATVTGIPRNQRTPYRAVSTINNQTYTSVTFTLQPLPTPDHPVKVLVTSDQQNRHMSPANFQKVVETVGKVDAVFFAGDLVDTPNRASEWFDRNNPKRPAFYPALQGRNQELHPEHAYRGGAILQHAPLFGTIGNHESPGIFDKTKSLGHQDNNPQPRWFAQWQWSQLSTEEQRATGMTETEFVTKHSYDHRTYYDMWDLPEHGIDKANITTPYDPAHAPENFYAIRYGNIHLTSMNISRVWRHWDGGLNGPKDKLRGKFAEPSATINNLYTWGFGDMFFADYSPGSLQRQWLDTTIKTSEYASAPYQVVLTHQSMHGYGDNSVPVIANPIATIEFMDGTPALVTTFPTSDANWQRIVEAASKQNIKRVRYQYPKDKDLWLGVEKALLSAGTDLVISGHSHVWSRTYVDNAAKHRMHYIESSNVGNTFGPKASKDLRFTGAKQFFAGKDATATLDESFWPYNDYIRYGDPHGRPDMIPTEVANGIDLMESVDGAEPGLPYLSSNTFTVFTIIDSSDGSVTSYGFDTSQPESEVVIVDRFYLNK